MTSCLGDPLLLRPRIVDMSYRDSTGDIQWGIDVVTTDLEEGTLRHPPTRYGTSVANQRGVAAKEAAYAGVLQAHQTVRLRPSAIETFDALDEDFQRFIRDAARHQAYRFSIRHDALLRLIYSMAQRITVAFMRTQAQVL